MGLKSKKTNSKIVFNRIREATIHTWRCLDIVREQKKEQRGAISTGETYCLIKKQNQLQGQGSP
jgi:hypothetical protein